MEHLLLTSFCHKFLCTTRLQRKKKKENKGGPQISIMNKRLNFAYLVLIECLIENGRNFE